MFSHVRAFSYYFIIVWIFLEGFAWKRFGKLVRLLGNNSNHRRIEADAQSIADDLRVRVRKYRASSTEVIGPAPCFFAKSAGRHRWHVVLRGPDPAELANIPLPIGWRIEIDPLSLL